MAICYVALFLSLGLLGPEFAPRLRGWVIFPPTLLAWGMLMRAAREPGLEEGVRRAWRNFSASVGLYIFAQIFWLSQGSPAVSAADAGYLLSYAAILWSLLSFPAEKGEGQRIPFLLDVAIVVLGGFMVVWYFVLGPVLLDQGRPDSLDVLMSLLYPVADLLVLLGVAVVLIRRQCAALRGALAWVSIGALALLIGDIIFSYLTLHGEYRSGGAPDVFWILASFSLAEAGYRQVRNVGMEEKVRTRRPRLLKGYILGPYVALMAGCLLMLDGSRTVWDEPLGGTMVAGVSLAMLAVVRQIRLFQDHSRLQRENAERRSSARFQSLVQHSSDGVALVDGFFQVQYASPALGRILGCAPEGLLGSTLSDWIHPEDLPRAQVSLARAVSLGDRLESAVWRLRHADGNWRSVEHVGENRVEDPSVGGFVLNLRDVTERQALEAQLEHQAFHDGLTGLANRALFRDRLGHALARQGRRPDGVAVLFLDLDDFKTVNDSLGHAAGDLLLTIVATRLLSATRGADTVARLGGDEFAVLLEPVREKEEATRVAERILVALREPILLEGTEVCVGGSLGIALRQPGETAEDLLRNADVAMYRAKRAGKRSYEVYQPQMHEALLGRLEMESDLRRAVESPGEQFRLVYQPIMDLESGGMAGVEALIRWHHPTRGVVSPAIFIPIAEETGLIALLGRWVLHEACRQWKGWTQREGRHAFYLTVNLSGRQLQRADVVAEVADVLRETEFPVEHLVLEITESVLMQDAQEVRERMEALKGLGLRLAIDDFGTGYSSLSYLQRFPVDILKIDKAFVDHVALGGQSTALARTIVALGESLGLRTVAEGIEDEAQWKRLHSLGCGYGQGYLFARPLPPEEIQALLDAPLPAPAGEVAGA